MGGGTDKTTEEVLYAEKSRTKYKGGSSQNFKKDKDKAKSSDSQGRGRDPNKGDKGKGRYHNKRSSFKCYNYGGKNHIARNCPTKLVEEGNAATIQEEEPWDAEALMAQVGEDDVLNDTTTDESNKLDEWIVDSGCSNHMTGEKKRLQDPVKYEGSRVVVIADNSKLPIVHIGDVVFSLKESNHELALPGVYHIPGMRNNLLSVSQLASAGHHGVFGPNDVKIYEKFETPSVPVLKGH